MTERIWHIDGSSGTHVVHLEHGYWSGKATVMLDDTVLCQRQRKFVDWGLKHDFTVDGMKCLVKITAMPWMTC